MIVNFLIFISCTLAAIIPFFPDHIYTILKAELIVYVLIIIAEMVKIKRLSLFQVWLCAFIYIILSEMLIIGYNDYNHIYMIPILFYLIGNNIVLIGYRCYNKQTNKSEETPYKVNNPSALIICLAILEVLYLYVNKDKIIETLMFGRILKSSIGGGAIESSLISGLGLLIPSFAGYYFRYIKQKNAIYSIIFSMPIFVYQFIMGTRFVLLFTIIPFLIISGLISLYLTNFRKNIMLLLFAIVLIFGTNYIKENRNLSANDREHQYEILTENTDEPFQKLADNMSPEGIIYMAKKANDYFDNNPLSYGKETGFILYFWIPRSIWPNKPTMLDHWLIRQTEIVSDSHSTASGFLGELRADFGWFSLFFAFLIGLFVRKCDNYLISFNTNTASINFVMALLFIPYIFFFVRSPLTSTMKLICELIVFLLIKKIFFDRVPHDEKISR